MRRGNFGDIIKESFDQISGQFAEIYRLTKGDGFWPSHLSTPEVTVDRVREVVGLGQGLFIADVILDEGALETAAIKFNQCKIDPNSFCMITLLFVMEEVAVLKSKVFTPLEEDKILFELENGLKLRLVGQQNFVVSRASGPRLRRKQGIIVVLERRYLCKEAQRAPTQRTPILSGPAKAENSQTKLWNLVQDSLIGICKDGGIDVDPPSDQLFSALCNIKSTSTVSKLKFPLTVLSNLPRNCQAVRVSVALSMKVLNVPRGRLFEKDGANQRHSLSLYEPRLVRPFEPSENRTALQQWPGCLQSDPSLPIEGIVSASIPKELKGLYAQDFHDFYQLLAYFVSDTNAYRFDAVFVKVEDKFKCFLKRWQTGLYPRLPDQQCLADPILFVIEHGSLLLLANQLIYPSITFEGCSFDLMHA